jgi:hypothetical protein
MVLASLFLWIPLLFWFLGVLPSSFSLHLHLPMTYASGGGGCYNAQYLDVSTLIRAQPTLPRTLTDLPPMDSSETPGNLYIDTEWYFVSMPTLIFCYSVNMTAH